MLVAVPGPPPVISQTMVKLASESKVISSALVTMVGFSSGKVTDVKRRIAPALSSLAASVMSLGTLRRAATNSSIARPTSDHMFARLTNSKGALNNGAEFGLPNSRAKVPCGTDAAYQTTAIVTGGRMNAIIATDAAASRIGASA